MRHFTSRKCREQYPSLTVNELGDLRDCEAFVNVCKCCIRLGALLTIGCYAHHHQQNPNLVQTIFTQQLLLWMVLRTLFWIAAKEYDAAVGDIPLAVKNAPVSHSLPRYRRFANFRDDTNAYNNTVYHIVHMQWMLACFDLPEICRVDRGRLDGKCYTFHREELLIYLLMAIANGEPHSKLSDRTGQKCDQRIGKGFKWLVLYLDDRYDHLLGLGGMLVWRQYFPLFAEKIREYIAKPISRQDDMGNIQVEPGVWFNPGSFNTAGFVDCKVYEIGTPHSGPAAPEPGSQRRPWWYDFQRAFYDGHHHVHAVKMLSFIAPNGLYVAIWGPASARRDDTRLVHWSKIDDLLFQMQRGYFGALYIFFGDSKFRVRRWRCIRGRHARTHFGPWNNARERAEDRVMNRARESIEHSYADQQNHLQQLKWEDLLKMGNDPVAMLKLFRVCHLFYNLRVCAFGSVVSSTNAFSCKPPTIQEYLNM
jgi:hypothetical protein